MRKRPARDAWRLEFPQPAGWPIPWLGPYTSQWLTREAEEIVRYMEAEHRVTRPHPDDPDIFLAHPGENRLVCGVSSRALLEQWFGNYLPRLREQGAHIARYSVPPEAIADDSADQTLFVHRRATLVARWGRPAPAPLVRSSAGARTAIIEGSEGRYVYDPRRGPTRCPLSR